MPLHTRDHRNVGMRTWRCDLYEYSATLMDTSQIAGIEKLTRAAAERWVRTQLPKYAASRNLEVISLLATIQEGVWVEREFTDDAYGRVLDAEWETEHEPRAYCQMADGKVSIEWEDDL